MDQAAYRVEDLVHWDRTIYWHPFTQMAEYEPLIFVEGEGCELVDINGNRYIDGVSSLWCNIHGHRHPRIDQAIREQLNRVAHVTALGCSHPTTILLAKRLVDIAPAGLKHVFFSDNGATAVEVALKMAFQYWRQCRPAQPERKLYIALEGAYHGDTLGAVSVGGVERFHAMFQPLLFPCIRLPAPDTYRGPAELPPEALADYHLSLLDEILRKHHREVVAVVIEPRIQAAAGMIFHPPGYLRGVRELTSKYDVFLIADEVAVGMGRTGRMFACEHEDVAPDFLCLAKGLTGGYLPLAATLTTDRVWEAFLGRYEESRTFFHGHTYTGNPLGAAAALATLDVFEEEQTLAKLPAKAGHLARRLEPLRVHPHVGDVRQLGLIAAVELVRDKATKEPYPWGEKRGFRVCDVARRHGVWLRPLGNVIVIMPPLSISLEQIDRIVDAITEGIEWATRD